MRLLTLILAISTVAARPAKTPPTLLLENATVLVREKAFDRIGKRRYDLNAYQLTKCYRPTGRPCDGGLTAAEAQFVAYPPEPRGALVLIAAEANCAGHVGVWHLLVKCLTNLVGDVYDATKRLPGDKYTAALVVVNGDERDETSGCRFGPLFESYRPLFEAFFAGGVHPSAECYRANALGDPAGSSFRHVLARTRAVGQGLGRLELLPVLRKRGFAAYGIAPPPDGPAGPAKVLHLTRDDAGMQSHRSLGDDGALREAFRQAGASSFDRCCDWTSGAAGAAIAAVASADIIVGAHGAAMTHLIWAKPTAIAVEVYSGALLALRRHQSLWFFRPFVKRHGAVFLEGQQNLSVRTVVDVDAADRIVRCAFETADLGASRAHCDPKK